jgi:dTDP-glucose 4,6-dehydratase
VTNFIHVPDDVHYVFHFASPASPIDYLKLPIQTLKVGSLGTHKALGFAKAKKARFLISSTSEVYGDPDIHPQVEEYWGNVNPIGPRGVYDEAKRFSEAMTMAYHSYHGLETRIVRIFNTYGERMRINDGRAIPAFLSQALRGEPVTVFGDGSQTRSVLRFRSHRRHLSLDALRLLPSGQHRKPRRAYHASVGAGNYCACGKQECHRL